MAEKDFEARLIKLRHDIDQLDAKIDDEISSLREESRKDVLGLALAEIRDISQAFLRALSSDSAISKACDRAYKEIDDLCTEYLGELGEVSVAEFMRAHPNFKKDVNRITRTAGLEDIWTIPGD